MKNIIISTDSTCDLPVEQIEQRNISVAHLHYYLDNVEQDSSVPFDSETYYTAMDKGAAATTSLCNQDQMHEMFSQLLTQGKDIVHISFSSALSGSYHNAVMAANELNATSKNKIYVVDTLCGSGGLALLVHMADDYANTGKSAAEVVDYLESTKMNIGGYFCLATVRHVIRGGRVARLASLIASAINIKLYLHCDNNGKLTVIRKSFSRKKTLDWIINAAEQKYNGVSDTMYLCHALCQDDAQYVADGVHKATGVMPTIVTLCPVIGSHGGIGALALFFTSTDRDKI